MKIDAKTLKQINNIILRSVDKIYSSLGFKLQSYNITIKNIGATSIQDMSLEISGHSLDISLFLAVLSAGLQLPINQETIFTGGLDTLDGHLSPVSGLSEKIRAVAKDKSLNHFVYASYNNDNSIESLAPNELKKIKQNFFDYEQTLKFSSVNNIFETIKAVVPEEDICFASLKSGFYSVELPVSLNPNPIGQTITYLLKDNDKKFWKVLEQLFLTANINIAKEYIHVFIEYFFSQACYPNNFGKKLLQLIISLPPAIKKKSNFYPLLEMKDYIHLTQYGKETDYDDIKKLFKVAFGELINLPRKPRVAKISENNTSLESETLLEQFLNELSTEN
ncbi:MAG: hypothetical protein U9N54_07395, partial [candidate division Zixibacteria bacterium]|nr:hypothetical protein [candidate division Zixibacteria bacterium]